LLFWISNEFNEVVIVSVSGSFCIMLSKRETAGAERKSFSGSTPIPVGMVWIGLVWYYLLWHAVACGCMQPQVFPSSRSSHNILYHTLINRYILRSAAFLFRAVNYMSET
jgi:hypothetical protein